MTSDTPGAVEDCDMAPDFALTDVYGNRVTLSDYRGKRYVVLVFNRGLG